MLITTSFQSGMDREVATAQKSYIMVLDTLSIVNSTDTWKNKEDISTTLDQLLSQSETTWSSFQLTSDGSAIYQKGNPLQTEIDDREELAADQVTLTHETEEDAHYLKLSGSLAFNNETLYLDASYDVSSLYMDRAHLEEIYRIIFVVMALICAALAYTISWLLTRPLTKLSRASHELASGNLSYRSRVRTNDEIGELSSDFDLMANRLEKGVNRLQDTLEQQDNFMGSFAHELKTPLTSIIGYADLLKSDKLELHEKKEAADYIFSEGKRLENLSHKLLDVFVLDQQNIDFKPVALKDIISSVVDHVRPSLSKDGVEISCTTTPGICRIEPDLVTSLIINLIDNARKALPQGGSIVIDSSVTREGANIVVSDNGKGIPPEHIRHLTEAFYRIDKARSRKHGGAGLGLTLCAKIVELHNGQMRFESRVDQGTRVVIELRNDAL